MQPFTERFYSAILDSIDCGVFTTDLDYRITAFNRAASLITGFTKKEAVGSYCYEIFRSNICQTDCVLKKTFQKKRAISNVQVDILSKSGKLVPVMTSTSLLKNEKNEIIGGIEMFRDIGLIEELRKEVKKQYRYEDIVSKNYHILKIFDILPDIADSDANVLIQGPSGTGKELFARAIHNTGKQKDGPFIAVNCGALPDSLLESELFGYEKGAFTDALRKKPGRFATARGGTIFLDEIGDTSPALQVKLLRVIQEKAFEPLGSVETLHTDARVIAATNKDLYSLVQEGNFREDLYYRLNVIKIDLPPLRKRKEDIPLLVDSFIRKYNRLMSKEIEGISEDALAVLMNYDYPGNIRELENIIEHAFVMAKGRYIDIHHFSDDLKKTIVQRPPAGGLELLEKDAIIHTLRMFDGNKSQTAEYLNIDRTTLWRKMKKYGIAQ
jgi:PAS domain S-box-containing protein